MHQAPQHRDRFSRARFIGLIAVACCLLAQFASVSHLILVAHVQCAVHGELEHASQENRVSSLDEMPSRAAHAVRSTPSTTDHEHDECLGSVRRHDVLNTTSYVVRIVAEKEPTTIAPLCFENNFASFALHRVAPKTSPPDFTRLS
ncbi:MAG: hypothetical protein R3A47_03455 [Polyangiales bacterium]